MGLSLGFVPANPLLDRFGGGCWPAQGFRQIGASAVEIVNEFGAFDGDVGAFRHVVS